MTDPGGRLAKANDLSSKVGRVFQKRMQTAQERFNQRGSKAYADYIAASMTQPLTPWNVWANWIQYSTDLAQRSVLFWDTLRTRGNNFVAHERAGKPPVLHFQYEIVLDARKFERPANYALLKITPPQGVTVDPKRRPYVIIDPRAGHGPGIGGFKDDSQVGVALREGHPVYFVMFYPEPEPGQTMLDVCAAEQEFIRKVRELHPDSPKPVIVGNCQGGWAAMLLAVSDPDHTGPIVINGSPMSYWSGAWSEGESENPMRYTGGLLGGSWLSSFMADLGNGVFDGAELAQNFEYLNPANTFWDKYYHLFANIDTEPERFLEFERWWGGYYLLNKEEIEWIVQNLFVGNKLWSDDDKKTEMVFDLRGIKSPIILFASLGDNITPPQQAFNWLADTYSSTEEIKARGQVIVGLVHQTIGHLGIFVSGRVAKKEHTQIVSVLKSIELLPPGLYAMHITEHQDKSGKMEYNVEFTEHRLEEIVSRINRFQRADEKVFENVAEVSEFNQRIYESFAQPLVQGVSNEYAAKLYRWFHPLRLQRWICSDLNPWLTWLGPAAEMVKAQRQTTSKEQPFMQVEQMMSELISASLDFYRDARDAACEAMFFNMYGTMFSLASPGEEEAKSGAVIKPELRKLPEVQEAVAFAAKGGYVEALCRTGYLLAVQGKPLPLARLELKQELMKKYRDFLPDVPPDERRRIRGKQELICRYEPGKAIATFPKLLSDPKDRSRFLSLLDQLVKDPMMDLAGARPTPQQLEMVSRIRQVLAKEQMPAAG